MYESDVALIGNRRFWIYRSLLDQAVADHGPNMVRATFTALEDESGGSAEAPIGLCLLLGPEERRLRSAEAVWPDPRSIYAGYLVRRNPCARSTSYAGRNTEGGLR